MLDFGNYSTKSKYYDPSNKLVIRKLKVEIKDIAIKEPFGLKPRNSEHRKNKKSLIKMLLQQ